MRVLMLPVPDPKKPGTSGIARVAEAYYKYLPDYGIQFVPPEAGDYDLAAIHIFANLEAPDIPLVLHNHGLHWSGDYNCDAWQYKINGQIVDTLRHAREVTVPSSWVAETFKRDMRFSPHVVPHGIDWFEWGGKHEKGDYILWNKNRPGDVCDPKPVMTLARQFTDQHFVTTYATDPKPHNVNEIGLIPYAEMKKLVKGALVYLSTTKETFGIGVLEAMAAGVPVLGVAHGGNVDLIQHGVTGYLARPGDFEDLADGLAYCLRHRDVLGENGRELSRRFSWKPVAEQVAGIYRKALEPDPPTAAIVIPCYNKSEEQLRRAVTSAINQTYRQLTEVIIVDDGSKNPDVSQRVADAVDGVRSGVQVRRIHQNNRGVANARNRGISATNAKYICCLDADDEVESGFLSVCIEELEKDASLGIAYTSILDVFPDGRRAISQWPPEFSFDEQLRGRNQIPTCCVFRRRMWERLGGYNQKYAPEGQGAEDAEFWLRAGATGWNAKKVTDAPLFVYYLGGAVTGNPNYREPDWLQMHPWTRDGLHPFASVATPVRMSHPVRQYDEPTVSFIIPVGPGHIDKVRDALDSIEAQTFRKWEAIVVWDAPVDADALEAFTTAYPYVRQLTTDGKGAGYARNRGVEIARAPFLVFLDADDGLGPEFLEEHLNAWRQNQAIVYSDYVGRAIIDDPTGLTPALQRHVYERNDRTGEVIIGYQAAEYDCERAQEQPVAQDPYIWCNVTALIPRTWFDEVGGFDESMPSWEDWDLHLRLARNGRCYHRIEKELMIYQFHTGNRRETGRQLYPDLIEYLSQKYERIPLMPCSSCGGRANRTSSPIRRTVPAERKMAVDQLIDADFIWVTYISSKGNHQLTGAHRFKERILGEYVFPKRINGMTMRRDGNGWRIDYGPRRRGGEVLLVHREDVLAMPGQFIPVQENLASTAPPPPREPPPAPEPLQAPPVMAESIESDAPPPPPPPELIEEAEQPFDLQRIPGVGPALARQFEARELLTKGDILRLGVEGLRALDGVGEKKAELIIRALEDAD